MLTKIQEADENPRNWNPPFATKPTVIIINFGCQQKSKKWKNANEKSTKPRRSKDLKRSFLTASTLADDILDNISLPDRPGPSDKNRFLSFGLVTATATALPQFYLLWALLLSKTLKSRAEKSAGKADQNTKSFIKPTTRSLCERILGFGKTEQTKIQEAEENVHWNPRLRRKPGCWQKCGGAV
jgi:hypothetical protein